ncbi:flagellar hook-associated protein FlgK [Craterilacuibacter sinensis]|uniref:Flagellar hook-associated protein 1 n=1 Tax=Craterilacuibacter sinensis TaxID=2686017 RepID=A0A845BNF9_9NEIS|nr:flagellar hook-associated protein FlgK [Craterilacuibacter sinensis]MXR35836.1 flagellar hook-associated protein FlgK [Craterilacuibacter sinensis]
MRMTSNALSGASAAQAALNTISQNISNVMTPGYSRQGVVLSPLAAASGDRLSAGSGVDVLAIRRYSDTYKNLQMWQAQSQQGQLAASREYFQQLEQVMGSSGTSLSAGLDKFYAALNAVSVEPASLPLRQQVISEADALVRRSDNLNRVFAVQLASVGEQRAAVVGQINLLSQQVAQLNQKVAAAEAMSSNVAGLLDERDRQIDALAKLVDVRVTTLGDGSKSISLPGGAPLVVGDTAAALSVEPQQDGSQRLTLQFANERFVLSDERAGGTLGGLGDYEKNVLRPQLTAVKSLMGQLATRTNEVLAGGFDLQGNQGKPLFIIGASDGAVSLAPLTAEELAFSSVAGTPANSGNLNALIAIREEKVDVAALGKVSFGDAYAQLVGQLAIASQQNKASLETAKAVRAEAESAWKSASGVNSDEEAVNLIEFQKMYQANMKVIAVAGELFDSTLAIL